MAGRVATKPLVFERETRCVLSTLNLMQNCDLPPPIKLFSGHEGILPSSVSKIYGMHEDCDKLEILKALRLSQTRAREAERKLKVLSNLIVDESISLYAHRMWVNLMEFQVLKLQMQQKENTQSYCSACNSAEKSSKMEDCDESNSSKKWCTAIAFCLAIAGMSFAYGCSYIF